jgi:hypothetical protein
MEARARRGQKKLPEEANQVIQVCILRLRLTLQSKNFSHTECIAADLLLIDNLFLIWDNFTELSVSMLQLV